MRQGVMVLGCLGAFLFLKMTVGEWLLLTLCVWLFTSGRRPKEAWRALLERRGDEQNPAVVPRVCSPPLASAHAPEEDALLVGPDRVVRRPEGPGAVSTSSASPEIAAALGFR